MRIEKTQVFGFEASFRGMRNPLDSWDKSDSFNYNHYEEPEAVLGTDFDYQKNIEGFALGYADMDLAQRLIKSGSEHCKFLRQIQVWVDLTLPRYIWSEYDTYKFNTKNSCSTMHTAHRRELTQDDFEEFINPSQIDFLNDLVIKRKAKDITSEYFIRTFKNNLPDGFLQKRTVNTNYAELINSYWQRKSHRLNEWHKYCEWIESLPYMNYFLVKGEE